jgi:L-threonylcarbamoyladenylate synthase
VSNEDRPGQKPAILPTDTPELFQRAVRQAVECLKDGGLVVLPTETVYGLAANAWDPAAVRRIFEVKNRPVRNPLIVHVAGADMVHRCVSEWPATAERLARAFWPGALTLVLRRSREIPDEVTGGGDTVGIRWPAHPLMQEVIRRCGFPVAAPSANRSNEVSPTTALHARASLGDAVSLILDGGASQVGIESTVIDLTTRPPRVLRPGMIHQESLAAVVGEVQCGGDPDARVLRSPGQLTRHYAPRARLLVLGWNSDAELRERLLENTRDLSAVHVLAHSRLPTSLEAARICIIPHDPEAYARAMYAEWHRCDELGAQWIVVEAVPDTPEWRGIADRLRRAAHSARIP